MTGFLRSIGFIGDEPSHVPAVATVESASVEAHEPTPSPADSVGGRDAERRVQLLQARLSHLEMARDLTLSDLMLAEADLTRHRRVWDAE